MTVITIPPTTRTVFWKVDSDEPSSPAVAPSPAKTVVKPGDEQQRRGHRARGIVRVAHLADDDAEVRGHERHDARREERRDAGAEERDDLGQGVAHRRVGHRAASSTRVIRR